MAVTQERTPPEGEEEKPKEGPQLPPQKQRPKMTLGEQNYFLMGLLNRCTMMTGPQKDRFAGEALLTLTHDDMLALEVVQQTLAVFELHRADVMVRDKISRSRGRK